MHQALALKDNTEAAQGRHRYYGLAGPQVAAMLEAIMGVAEKAGPRRVRPGPRDASMREARVCYDHLAGRHAVMMLDGFLASGILVRDHDMLSIGRDGERFFASAGIDIKAVGKAKRPACRECLDWSVRRSHLAGALGAAILDKVLQETWAKREEGGRAVLFTPAGMQAFSETLVQT